MAVMARVNAVEGYAFISYIREDAARVNELQQVLHAGGVHVWRDTVDLLPGDDWRLAIRRAISTDALAFLACYSQNNTSRGKSIQNEELALAVEQLRLRQPDEPWLIPVRFDDCQIPDIDIGTGRTLASIQRADLFGDRRDDETARLVAAVSGSWAGNWGRLLRPAGLRRLALRRCSGLLACTGILSSPAERSYLIRFGQRCRLASQPP